MRLPAWQGSSSGPLLPTQTPPLRSHRNRGTSLQWTAALHGAATASSVSPEGFGSTVRPLAERESSHTCTLHDLALWYCETLSSTAEVAEQLATALPPAPSSSSSAATAEICGHGWFPTCEDLKTELTWLVEDAVAGTVGNDGNVCSQEWRDVERSLQAPLWHLLKTPDAFPAVKVALRCTLQDLKALWHRRVSEREPVQYLLERCHWRDLILAVGPGCLIPRPETELLIDFAEAGIRQNPALAAFPWADLGTGSGALAVALGAMLKAKRKTSSGELAVVAVDASDAALRWAQTNVDRNGLQGTVTVAKGSWCEPLQPLAGKVGGILSNPPYIPGWKIAGLQAEVEQHEPHMALDGGPGEGLDAVWEVVSGAAGVLCPGGFLALEMEGGHQTAAVQDVLQGRSPPPAGMDAFFDGKTFENVEVRADYAGIRRFLTCVRARN